MIEPKYSSIPSLTGGTSGLNSFPVFAQRCSVKHSFNKARRLFSLVLHSIRGTSKSRRSIRSSNGPNPTSRLHVQLNWPLQLLY
mmetsp:Transcript_5063/g.5766  ORF Transcript_5063/g.5766 Transcript_5063/m.5766 type:complete len:84 (-) Transcript_5063:35-286(-)